MHENKVMMTEEGTIRTPSASPESMHEFSMYEGRVLYRWIRPDGSSHRDGNSQWMNLSTDEIRQHYYNGPPELRKWFDERGITKDWIRDALSAEQAAKPRRGRPRRS